MEINYGPIFITDGDLQSRIGYYDDNDSVFSDDSDEYPSYFTDDLNWRDPVGCDDLGDDVKVLDVAIIYMGNFFLADGYYLVPEEFIRPVTTADLMKRREELHDLCGAYAKIKNPDLDDEEKLDYFRELHYVDSTLVDRMVETRYSNREKGKKIFISHSSKDKKFAKWIGTDLKAAGHSPWLDEWAIEIGESIPKKVANGIKDADFMVVILSKNSTTSRWVENEWQAKYWSEVEYGSIQVLPVLYQDCTIPELLKTKKYADFRNNYNDGLEDILLAIDRLSGIE